MLQSSSSAEEISSQNLLTGMNEPGVNSVKIGKQVWSNKDLTISRYRNGDKIPQVPDAAARENTTTGAWCITTNVFPG